MGMDSGKEAAPVVAEGGAKKKNGEMCGVDADCESDRCKSQGTGGGGGGGSGAAVGTFCTIFCAMPNTTPAPECTDPIYTGKCSGMNSCQVK